MNEQSYEEYIRSILGYPNTISNSDYNNNMSYIQDEDDNMLEECYPEIYKIIYPMVVKTCSNNTNPITKELIEDMTDEIYGAIESNNEISININLNNEITTTQNRSSNYTNQNVKKEIKEENRRENRQFRNTNLRDLIKILLIRELLRRRRFPRNRPPFPGGLRPGPGPRFPIMPRSNMYYNDIYE